MKEGLDEVVGMTCLTFASNDRTLYMCCVLKTKAKFEKTIASRLPTIVSRLPTWIQTECDTVQLFF